MDDTPPFPIDQKAVDIAIEIAMLCGCQIVGEAHIARKQYLDGSIPTGFQRTTLVGVSGGIPFKGRTLGIIQLGLEEDACREVSDVRHQIQFRTNRLGMPLIEVVTRSELYHPYEVAEAGQLISQILRATGKVRRGIGSVRQDVNVSITGSTRVEIKGVPRIPLFPRLVSVEAYRQKRLLELRDMLLAQGIAEKSLEHSVHEAARADSLPHAAVGARAGTETADRSGAHAGHRGAVARRRAAGAHFRTRNFGARARDCLPRRAAEYFPYRYRRRIRALPRRAHGRASDHRRAAAGRSDCALWPRRGRDHGHQ